MQVNQKEIESATFIGTKMKVVITASPTASGPYYASVYSVKRGHCIGTSLHDTQDEAFAFARNIIAIQ
jgi:hypothetical protein